MDRLLALVGLIVGLLASLPPSSLAVTPGVPAGACRWLVSPGGIGIYHTVFTDLDQTPLEQLRFGESYSPPRLQIARDGFLDFNADQRADVFRVRPRPDGLWQWQYLPGSSDSWVDLNYASPALTDLRFGDFDGDGRTDIFTTIDGADGHQWLVSYSGVSAFQLLRSDPLGVTDLRLGDFNDDGKTDIFSVAARPDGLLQWRYASAGSGPWVDLNYASLPLTDLRFGDFDGDGRTDVFTTIAGTGGYQWLVSYSGVGSFQLLRSDPLGVTDLRLGDFNDDGKTDIFSVDLRPDGLFQWRYASAGSGPWIDLNYAAQSLSELRIGLFNDGLVFSVLALSCAQYQAAMLPPSSAGLVLGQADFRGSQPNRSAAVAASTLAGPSGLLVTPDGRLFVADYHNSRVLIWQNVQGLLSGQPADLALGQADLQSGQDPEKGRSCVLPTAATLCGPEALAYDARGNGTLYVADTVNSRVLAYRGPFTATNRAAVRVYGQADMFGGEQNRGKGEQLDLDTLNYPRGLAFDPVDRRLFVADDFNHRVLVFSVDDGDTLADLVLGYPDFTSGQPALASNDACADAISPSSMCSPKGLAYDSISDSLYVADYAGHRVLQFRGPFIQNNQPARLAFGQNQAPGNLISRESMCQYGDVDHLSNLQPGPIAADRFCNPLDLALTPSGALLVTDATNSRVLAFADPLSAELSDALAPDAVYGQRSSFTSGEKNRPDPPAVPTSETLCRPMGMAVFQGALYLSDFDNNRVLRFSRGAGQTVYLPLAVHP